MAYNQVNQYGWRDKLPEGDPDKVIKGDMFDQEFSAISAAIASISSGGGGGGGSLPDGSVDWANVENKPVAVKNLAGENVSKVSILSGGNY